MKRIILSILAAAAVITATACEASVTDSSSEVHTAPDITTTASEEHVDVPDTTPTVTSTEAPDSSQPAVPAVWSPVITDRQEMFAEGYLCAAAYLGYVSDEMTGEDCAELFYNSRYSSEFPEITDIPTENCVGVSGYELYLVIPADENATVSVNEWLLTEENDFMGESGEVYYRSEVGAPVLIRCNVSDIMPSVVVNITDSSGASVQWCPSISLKDGSVSRYGVEDKVKDITHYIYNETYECYQIEGEPQ